MQVSRCLNTLAVFVMLLILSPDISAFDQPLVRSSTKGLQQEVFTSASVPADKLASQEAEMSITLAGSTLWQGMADAVVSGNRAYCWMSYGLEVVDITNPATPVILYRYPYPAFNAELAIVGNALYVVILDKGLLVFDVTASPTLLNVFPAVSGCYFYGFDIVGNYFYLTHASVMNSLSGLEVFDISNPMSPVSLGFVNVPMLPNNVDVQGDYAYVTDEWNLNIVSIANKTSPQWLSSVSCNGDAWDVEVSGSYAYVSNRADTSLIVINVTNPQAPYLMSRLTLDTGDFWPSMIKRLDHYLYVKGSGSCKIVDIAVGAAPTIVGSWQISGMTQNLHLSGSLAYGPNWSDGLAVYDLADPLLPVETWRLETPGMGYDLEMIGNYAVEANGTAGIQIIDVSNPEDPQVVASHDTPGDAQGVAIRDNYAFVTDSSCGLLVFDLTIPTAPVLVGSCAEPRKTGRIVVQGNYAYVADYNAGVAVIDISNPAVPTWVTTFDAPGICFMYIDAGRLFVSNWTHAISIYDITIPQSPALLGSQVIPPGDWNAAIAARGNYMFVAKENATGFRYGSLFVYDISDPQTPIQVGEVVDVDFTRSMVIAGDYLYMADYTLGIQVINIANPEAPYRAGSYDTNPGWPWALEIQGDLIYVAADNGFLTLYTGNCAGPDGIGAYNVSDAVFLISYIFGGGPAPIPAQSGDPDCSGDVNVSDAVFLINYIFGGGAAPCGGCD